MKKEKKISGITARAIIIPFVTLAFFLIFFFCYEVKVCYKVQLYNGKEEIVSPEVYNHGVVWIENNCLIYRPFRAAFYIVLKDSVCRFEKIKCG